MTASYLPSIYTVLILLIATINCIISIDIERIFISGSADTTQIFHLLPKNSQVDNSATITIKRHHHVCYHKSYTSSKDPQRISQEGKNKCCFELYQLGLLHRDDKQYCESHIALIPNNLHHIGSVGFGVAPEYYLALDEQVTNSDTSIDDTKGYKQNRQLNVYEDKEKETLHDNLKTRGVNAYSPFHLTGFTSSRVDGSNGSSIKSMYGNVEGVLSSDGGMHRNFHQKLILSLDNISSHTCGSDAPSEDVDSCEDSRSSHQQININATILLPIMESIFIDADDPLLVEYGNDSPPEGIACKVSLLDEQKTKEVSSSSSKCDIQFIHPEVIDIEQPSFASGQHVVAYQISASLDFTPPNQGDELEIAIDYGTTLHIRYPSPIVSNDKKTDNGLVPVVIQQPILYAASATIHGVDDTEEQRYRLQTDVTSPSFEKAKSSIPPNPIVIHVAAGLDDDYWWITILTMSSALIGGLVLMKSLDSVSIWN